MFRASLAAADGVEFALEGKAIESGDRQGEKKADPAVELEVGFAEGAFDVFRGAANRRGGRGCPNERWPVGRARWGRLRGRRGRRR